MYLTATFGESIGKRAAGIRIVKTKDGLPPGFVKGVLIRRWLIGLLSWIPMFGLLDVAFILGEDRQCLHDMMASTQVVNVSRKNTL